MDFEPAAAAVSAAPHGGQHLLFEGKTSSSEVSSAAAQSRPTFAAARAEGATTAVAAMEENGTGQASGDLAEYRRQVAPARRAGPAVGGARKHEIDVDGSSSSSSSSNMPVAAQGTSMRAAKNGREQQRAQKISDVIDQLKVTLDKANFSDGSSSKLNVLVRCESYLRSLKDKIQCYELEAKLREIARAKSEPSAVVDASGAAAPAGGSRRRSLKMEKWAAKNKAGAGRGETKATASTATTCGSSHAGETDRMDTGDDSSNNGGSSNGKQQLDSSSSASSSDDDENNRGGGVMGISGVKPRGASPSGSGGGGGGGTDNASSTGSDGDAGSSDSGGGSSSAGTTDSASQGFTTDTNSRGFTTDSSFSGYTGSLGSGSGNGDTGSAEDGGSDESEEGTAGARMRVVNYFDIFRLSNVPMAIADKSGALVDVNDAMRGFGRINQDAVEKLTVGSLVAPESSKALQEAMSSMLKAASEAPQPPVAPPQLGSAGAQPFLANAGIGNRPTLLTVSLVYDESGEASAFHVALIPRSNNGVGAGSLETQARNSSRRRNSTEYDHEGPEFSVQKPPQTGSKRRGAAREVEEAEEEEGGEGARGGEAGIVPAKRGRARTWDAGGQNKAQKRRAAEV